MDVRIAQPLGYSELGSRSNNEDYLYPDPQSVSKEQKWFIVCDGVGGVERGEVASELAITSLDSYLRQNPTAVATNEFVQQAVAFIETQFNRYLSNHQEAVDMATTLTLVYFHKAGATVAHIGDSRVYHIRNGRVIWRTDDHSYVNELLKAGVLLPSEAHNHPQRNVITRALQGGGKPVEASVQIINDLRPGDYFFLCTDGILERISDELLAGTLFSPNQSNEQKINTLRQCSLGNTRDNFTAYLIQIEHVSGSVDPSYRVPPPVYEQHSDESEADESVTLINIPVPQEFSIRSVEAVAPSVSPRQPQEQPPQTIHQPLPRTKTSWLIPSLALAGALAGAGGYMVWQQYSNRPDSDNEPAKTVTLSIPATRPTSFSPASPTNNPADTELVDLTVPAIEMAERSDATSPDVNNLETSDPKKTSDRTTAGVEIVVKVNKQVSVVRDSKTKRLGLQRSNGKLIGGLVYSSIGPFENGVAPASLDGKKGYLNRDGRWFDEIGELQNGKVAVRKGDRWGYLNTQGQVHITPRYERAKPFQLDGTAEVVENGKTIRIDRQGNMKKGNE